MLRSRGFRSHLRRGAVAVTLVGWLLVPLSACSSPDRSSADLSVDPDAATTGRSRATPAVVAGGGDPLARRPAGPLRGAPGRSHGRAGVADGYIPDGASLSPFEAHPAIDN